MPLRPPSEPSPMPMLDFLSPDSVVVPLRAQSKKQVLHELAAQACRRLDGLDEREVFETLLQRERLGSTGIGEGVAIPHGTDEARSLVRKTTLGFLQFPDGIDWDGNDVRVCVAIAAKGNEHMAVLSGLAQILMEPEQAEALRSSSNVDEVLELLSGIGEEDE